MIYSIYTSVPPECVHGIADRYRVPAAVVYAIIKTEGGSPGFGHRNSDGSIDWGPMQINGRWFTTRKSPVRRRFPYLSPRQIETDPCVNTEVGVWILAGLRQHASLWTAVGHYHSFNPVLASQYVARVRRWYYRILADWRRAEHRQYPVVTSRRHRRYHVRHAKKTIQEMASAGEY